MFIKHFGAEVCNKIEDYTVLKKGFCLILKAKKGKPGVAVMLEDVRFDKLNGTFYDGAAPPASAAKPKTKRAKPTGASPSPARRLRSPARRRASPGA